MKTVGLILLVTVVTIVALPHGRASDTIAVGQSQSATPSPTPQQQPALKTEDLLKVRDLQYQQAKRLLAMRQMEKEYKALQDAVDAGQRQMDEVIRAGAKAGNVDLEKWLFDSDSLRFVARPAPTPTQSPAKAGTPN